MEYLRNAHVRWLAAAVGLGVFLGLAMFAVRKAGFGSMERRMTEAASCASLRVTPAKGDVREPEGAAPSGGLVVTVHREGGVLITRYSRKLNVEEQFRFRFRDYLAYVAPSNLQLNDAETAVLTNAVYTFIMANGEVKAEVAKIERKPDGSVFVRVPARLADAADLWASFRTCLAEDLTAERTDQIIAAIGSNLGAFLGGLGVCDEEYSFVPAAGQPGMYDFSYIAYPPETRAAPVSTICGNWAGEFMENMTDDDSLRADPKLAFLARYLGERK
jgi:hypothetical protein